MTVKRYAMINHGSGCLSIGEWDGGEYVKYEDYAALQAKANSLSSICSGYRKAIIEARSKLNVGNDDEADDVLAYQLRAGEVE